MFSSANDPDRLWAPHILQFNVLSLGLKRPEHEPDHSLPSSTEMKNECSHGSTTSHIFMSWRGRTTFLFDDYEIIS
jgi:hypothetical protein